MHYRFCHVGLTPSPAILSSLIGHQLESRKEEHPEIASLLEDSFWDLIKGIDERVNSVASNNSNLSAINDEIKDESGQFLF